jgi:type VI secretion system secreted protein VgrG
MKKVSIVFSSLTFAFGLMVATANAQAPVNLGSSAAFAILAGTTATVTGAGTISGNVGIYPGTAWVPGTPPVTVHGTIYAGGPIAAQAQADLTTAYNDAAGRSVAPITVAGNIGGQTLAPGLYKSTSSLAISSGDLTLDGGGNANAVWIFQIASTLTTTSGRQVILAGGANAANIFWQVGTSATIGTTSAFQGNILAAISISMLTGSTLSGRALAMGGAVSIDTGGGSSATIPVAPTAPTVISTLNAASYSVPVVAGSIAAVFGSNLSIGQGAATMPTPLPTTLAQSSFMIGGHAAPLYMAMPAQVNLQIPWELAGQAQTAVIATVNGVASNTQIAPLATFAPGIFTVNSTGTGQGAVLIATTAVLAAPGSPVLRGGYVSIFCTGLGPVTNQPATGAAALVSPLSWTLTTPTVTIGGLAAVVGYAGLAPDLAGLYQVNAIVPSGVFPGNFVGVVVNIGGVASNTVTIAVE